MTRVTVLTRVTLGAMLVGLGACLGSSGSGHEPRERQDATHGAFGTTRDAAFSRLQQHAAPVAAPATTLPYAPPVAAVGDASSAAPASVSVPLDSSGPSASAVDPVDVSPVDRAAASRPRAVAEERQHERELRQEYANSSDPVGPALRLAGWLADRERHPEALFVLTQAIARGAATGDDDPALRLAYAGLLRDTGRHEESARELRIVVRDRQRHAVAPGTLLELAQVELLAGQRDQARRTYHELLQVVGDGDWYAAHDQDLAQLRTAIERPDGRFFSMRDQLALVRSAPAATMRVQLIEQLLSPVNEGDAAEAEARAALRERVLAIGCGDESAAVRACTLRAAAALGRADVEFWQAALFDDAALVRSVAASAVVDVLRANAIDLLLQRLDVEADATAFAAMHRALQRVVGGTVDYRLQADEEAGRAAARNWWHERCGR